MNKEKIIELIKDNKNIFITGQAGVGKSYMLNEIIDYYEKSNLNFAITASTGIAALPLGGVTAHSFFGSNFLNHPSEIDRVKKPEYIWKYTKNRLNKVDVIIIDEISMIQADLFNLWDLICRHATGIFSKPFGGIQLIISGDFMQLPPVIRDRELNQNDLVFNSNIWKTLNIETVVLTEVKRQDDIEFIKHLGDIRLGNYDEETINYFNNLNRSTTKDVAKLVATNKEALQINNSKLNEIESESFSFTAKVTGAEKDRINIIKECIADEVLILKKGAKVMGLINSQDNSYVNGSIGIVKDVSKHSISVTWASGKTTNIISHTWEKNNSKNETIAKMIQYPIKLAWAITMHKSQGMTIDELQVDCRRIFAEGQLYVSLSRAKTAKELYLIGFDEKKIKINKYAKTFYENGGIIDIEEEDEIIIDKNVKIDNSDDSWDW